KGGGHDPSAIHRALSGQAAARRACGEDGGASAARRGTLAPEDRLSARSLGARRRSVAAAGTPRPPVGRRDHRTSRAGEGDRAVDRADVPHVPARPPRRAPRARPRRTERHPARIWTEEAADAEGRAAHRREMAAVRVDRELVSLAFARERRRTGLTPRA